MADANAKGCGHFAASLATCAALFFGGLAAGMVGARSLAGPSGIVTILGFVTPPLAFVSALFAWQGMAFFSLILNALIKGGQSMDRREKEAVAAGAYVLVPVPIAICAIGGLVVGALGPGALLGAASFAAGGFVYGILMWTAARMGLLDFSQFFDEQC